MINRRLYDLLIRHQLYVEGYKNYQIIQFKKELPKLIKALCEEFKKVPYKKLDEMTKRELNEFQRDIKKISNEFFDYWNNLLIKELDEFTKSDFEINKGILANFLIDDEKRVTTDKIEIDSIIAENARKEDENKLVPFAWIFENDTEKLKRYINNTLIPAVGMSALPKDILNGLSAFSMRKIITSVNAGFANGDDTEKILQDIIGTDKEPGIVKSIETAHRTITSTIIQHITCIVGPAVLATSFDRYQWVSVIDAVTSNICRGRNLNIYYYGKGPLPPAHANCRSKTVPYLPGQDMPSESFPLWASNQPTNIQKYAASKFSPLNLDQYVSKLESILTR